MLRAAAILAVLLVTTAAEAQQSFHPKNVVVDPEEGVPTYKRKYLPPAGYVSPENRLLDALARPPAPSSLPFHAIIKPNDPQPATLTPVVMNGGMGGLISAHQLRFSAIGVSGAPVEMRGGCWSACTMITGFIRKDRLCFAPGAFLAFHAARTAEPPYRISESGTWAMYFAQPPEIRQWLEARGGVDKMTMETYWTMSDRELWALGYPRCK